MAKRQHLKLAQETSLESTNPVNEPLFLFFDTETTGLPEYKQGKLCQPRLVQLAWRLSNSNRELVSEGNFIVKPTNFTIPAAASKIHGITDEYAREHGTEREKVIMAFLSDLKRANYLIAHNISYDYNVMTAEFKLSHIDDAFDSIKHRYCTMKESVDFCKIGWSDYHQSYKWPKLQELHHSLFKSYFDNAHNAMADILATEKCFWELVKREVMHIKTDK